MCGIAGFLDPNCTEAEARMRLARMLKLISHRGPDGEGTHTADGMAIGMRRLSIIDLEGGAQPIWNEDNTVGVVFNGEIYNYVELRRDLEASGHRFRTQSDTEVLVHLYEERGEAMVNRLRGMFAFAILDKRQRLLLLARDHFGQKPLYLTRDGDRLAFASELKSLLALPWVSREEDPGALFDYVSWLSLPPPHTHFRHIEKLRAGSLLLVPLDAPKTAEPRKYWRYQLTAEPDLCNLEDAIAELDRTLEESVRLHLRADVPVGVLLSSGLDSRVVTAYAHDLHARGMQTFTVGFGAEDSELLGAAETAREIGSHHHELELTANDFLANIDRIAHHLDEPIGDPACFAVLKVCELARHHVKVLLSGEGSDELFGGYDGRYLGIRSTLERSDEIRCFAPFLPVPRPKASPSRMRRLLTRVHHTRGSEALTLRIEGFPGDVRHPRGLTLTQIGRLDQRAGVLAKDIYRSQRDVTSELLTLDLDWQLAESLLQKADKMSMGASIELRTPLLDLEVARVAARIPTSLKLPPEGPGKFVLRQCLARKLNEPLNRPKKGFPVPLTAWFAGPLRERVEADLFSDNAACLHHLDRALLQTAWKDFLAGEWNGALAFYALWLYEVWHKTISATPSAQ